MKKILSVILVLVFALSFSACGNTNMEGARVLSFAEANSVKEMRSLNGKPVTIIGYMATLSPVSGQFMYLMNMPYQSCPFCQPNTTELSNTMAVYAQKGKEFEFTDRAVKVTGIMDFGNFTDEFGYEYSYRIKDATYTLVDTSDMGEKQELWLQLASSGAVADAYAMFEYVNFLCCWPTYTAKFAEGEDYLYPSDAIMFVEKEGAQYSYGKKDGYFEGIAAAIEEVDKNAFSELVAIIPKAKALSEKAYDELLAENYTQVPEYSGAFKDSRYQYKMTKSEELENEMSELYHEFSMWLAEWEI